jgi:hypothetical protein
MRRPARLLGANRGFDARLSEVVHARINAVVLFCFIDKKIFQNVLPVCWGERFFADTATNQAARKFGVRTHTNELVA